MTKRYEGLGQPTVDGITLEIASGEAVAVLRPSGNGGSTLPGLIADFDRPARGTITAAGQRIDRLTGPAMAGCRRGRIGMVFQFIDLLYDLPVARGVLLPARLAAMPRSQARARARAGARGAR